MKIKDEIQTELNKLGAFTIPSNVKQIRTTSTTSALNEGSADGNGILSAKPPEKASDDNLSTLENNKIFYTTKVQYYFATFTVYNNVFLLVNYTTTTVFIFVMCFYLVNYCTYLD